MKGRWGVHVCNCEDKLPLDAGRLDALGALVDVGRHPRSSAEPLAVKAREQKLDGLLIACCRGAAPFQEALRAQHVALDTRAVDLGARAFRPTAGAAEANGKALRLLRGELRAAQRGEPPEEVPLRVGKRVALITDLAGGLALAESLGGTFALSLVVSPDLELPAGFPARRARRGSLAGLRGRLGAFWVRVRGPGGAVEEVPADQVVLALREAPALQGRTGVHLLVNPGPEALAGLPAALRDGSGDFMKALAVRYDSAVCAGGSAGQQACGRCIPACPYQAISRDPANPLRIAVDHLACEGCGACTAACPTSALAFTEPSAGEMLGRLAGLLGPAEGAPQPPLGVVFHCSQQGRLALAAAASRPRPYAARLLPVEVPCLRHVSDALLLGAFRMGAAGAALLGCEQCPHGERALLTLNLEIAGRVAEGSGLGAGRIRLVTVRDGAARPDDALEQLDEFAAGLPGSAVAFNADRIRAMPGREVVAEAILALLQAYGARQEPVALPRDAPYANAKLRADGCTLCRSCANVCPTHAFRFDEGNQALEFKQIACVACGLCEAVCPENVISLSREAGLNEAALDYRVLVRDETVGCLKCGKPYINRRALDAVESRMLNSPKLAGVFAGRRAGLLRLCPDCRAIAAMMEVQQGWRP